MGSCAGSKRDNGVVTVDPTSTSTLSSSATTKGKEISVGPSQFVREQVGDFREHYDIGKKLGGGELIH